MARQYDAWTKALATDKRFRYRRIFKVGAGLGKDLDGDDGDNGNADADADADAGAYTETLHYLLSTKHGAALLRRTFPRGPGSIADLENFARQVMRIRGNIRVEPRDRYQSWHDAKPEVTEKGFPMNRADELEAVIKRVGGFAALCKRVGRVGAGDISERELTLMATGTAMNRLPGLTDAAAFAKVYGDPRMSDEARAFWDAIGVIRGTLAPDEDEEESDERGEDEEEEENGESAYDEVQREAAKLRKRDPSLSEAQAFARIYENPANVALRKRERAENGF
jgi:hypothetical protein